MRSLRNIRACVPSRSATARSWPTNCSTSSCRGVKTATCSTEDEPNTSTPGERWIVLDGRGEPRCVIETTEVTYRRFGEVDAAFAYEEGEGDRSLDLLAAGASQLFRTTGPVQRRHDADVRTFPAG